MDVKNEEPEEHGPPPIIQSAWLPSARVAFHGDKGFSGGTVMLIWINSPEARSSKFLFLDRDGVINEDRPDFITCWDEYRFYPDALEALRWLNAHGVQVIIVSNQSGLNRGIIDWQKFWEVHHRMTGHIQQAGGDILAAFYCPHRPDEKCRCRKPLPGMIFAASQVFPIPLHETFMIGDRLTDLQAASQAGCHGILLDRESKGGSNGNSTPAADEMGVARYPNLLEAVLALWAPGEA